MTKTNYQAKAAYCLEMAAKAPTEDLKVHWYEMTEIWNALASEQDRFGSKVPFVAMDANKGAKGRSPAR